MNSKSYITPQRNLRFRRWSRKSYALFASLGRCVTIGQVSKSITERAVAKLTAPTPSCSTQMVPTDACPDNAELHTMPATASELLLITISPVQLSTPGAAPAHYTYIYSINHSIGAPRCVYTCIYPYP